MPVAKASSGTNSSKLFLWLLGVFVVLTIVAVRFFSEKSDPRSSHARDRIYYVDLEPLPADWVIEWASEEKSARRLKLLSPQRDSIVQVFAFKGDLDRGKFNAIVDELYEKKLPMAQRSTVVAAHYAEVERSEYERPIPSGGIIYTTIDLIWEEARQDYAYIVTSDSDQPSGSSVRLAQGALIICPPRPTAVGKTVQFIVNLGEHVELLLALFLWGAATIWGLRYTAKWLDTKWKLAKYLFAVCLLASPMAAHALFSLNWLVALLVPTMALIAVGASAALISGRWELEE